MNYILEGVGMPQEKDRIFTTKRLEALKTISRMPGHTCDKDFLDDLVVEAEEIGASDIHIEPMKFATLVRFRIDGILYDIFEIPKEKEPNLISSMKVAADMDITEKRRPQDGRLEMGLADRTVKIRVSTLPQIFGEKVVLRIFNTDINLLRLDTLGFTAENQEKFGNLIQKRNGIILVSGPTGSGKTTTLYAAMNNLRSPVRNIVSVEDPIEFVMDRINQIQVKPEIQFTYANILRAILRQDPDVITIGEIRDLETAQMVIHAALTGHLILTTLHANDTIGCITRLLDMGLEPFLVASALNGAVVQRLVRKICPNCVEEVETEDNPMGISRLYQGMGCEMCRHTGYKGRTALHEVLVISENIRKLIHNRASEDEILVAAKSEGFNTLQDDAINKVCLGITTAQEAYDAIRD